MRSLIIGAAGFVGPYLASAVKTELGSDVVATKLEREQLELPDAQIRDLNIMDEEQIFELLDEVRPEYIFHLAAQSSVAYSWKDPSLTVDVNIKGALNLMNALRRLDHAPRVLIVGSGEEYGHIGPDDVPVKETQLLRPGNVYAATKAAQNMLAAIYAEAYGLELIMTRSFNHMGPRQTQTFVVGDFTAQAVRIELGLQEPVIRVGNLSAKRDFTDVRDVVKAYAALARSGAAGETYNVGTGHALEIREILDTIIRLSGQEIAVETDPAKLRPVDVPIIEPDTEKIRSATGWRPQIPLEQTITDMLAWWRAHKELL